MREIKFSYVWERPKAWAGPYRPDDAKVKITYMSLEDLEKGRFIRPSGYPDNNYSLLVAKHQYTGLKDKNGRETYHKDILRDCKTGSLWVVEWDDEWARFTLVSVKTPFHERDKHRLMVFLKRMEYVGNAYENPELI